MTTSETPAMPARWPRRRRAFGDHVALQIANLQQELLRPKPAGSTVALMARLRAAATKPPGYEYSVLAVTEVPHDLLEQRLGDEPSDREWAKHSALTLWALHQQSIGDQPMHRGGQPVGTALRSLAQHEKVSADAVEHRFAALGTAARYDATLYHLRALIGQLRQRRLPLDYGLLADDLLTLRRPDGHAKVRATWGRDYYRAAARYEHTEPNRPTSQE